MKTIIALFSLLFSLASTAQVWSTLSDMALSSNDIRQFSVYGDVLYIGSNVSLLNSMPTSGVFTYDSLDFQLLSSAPAPCYDFEVRDTVVFVVGEFLNVDNIPGTGGIAALTSNGWETVGGGGSSPGECAWFQNKLYVSNDFNVMGELTEVFGFACWDGTSWSAPESVYGFDVGPRVMCVFNGELIGGGDIDLTTEGVPINNVARFDGTHWYDMNGGMSGTVQALYPDEELGILYVAGNGSLAQFGDVSCPNNVVAWDGNSWSPVGTFNDINYDIKALTKYRGQLYAGGYFQLNNVTEKLAYFDGVHWKPVPLAGTIEGSVNTLTVYKDQLYVGGTFPEIGGLEVPGLARYFLDPDSVQWGVPDTTDVVEKIKNNHFNVFPNPAGDHITIQFDRAADGELLVTDLNGKTLWKEALAGRKNIRIETSHLSRGTVFVNWINGVRICKSRKVVLN